MSELERIFDVIAENVAVAELEYQIHGDTLLAGESLNTHLMAVMQCVRNIQEVVGEYEEYHEEDE
jgi:hypothetical protein